MHDVIGTRCDPYTHNLLAGGQYHHCCHSNLSRALADHLDLDGNVLITTDPYTGVRNEGGRLSFSPVRPAIGLCVAPRDVPHPVPSRPLQGEMAPS